MAIAGSLCIGRFANRCVSQMLKSFCSGGSKPGPVFIPDNGPQFIAKDFKAFIRLSGMTQVRTSPYYPQSNGKIERWHRSLKSEAIRPGVPLSLKDAQRIVGCYVVQYNEQRLQQCLGLYDPQESIGRQSRADPGPTPREISGRRSLSASGPGIQAMRLAVRHCPCNGR